MIKFINNEEYIKNKLEIQKLIAGIFKNDNDKIANLEETMEHLDFIFAQKNNKALLLLNIENDELICMVNFLEYNNIFKDWSLFSVFTKKDKRRNGYASEIIKEGIKIIKQFNGNKIVSGIEDDNISSKKLHEELGFVYEGKNWDEIAEGFPKNHLGYVYYIEKDGHGK